MLRSFVFRRYGAQQGQGFSSIYSHMSSGAVRRSTTQSAAKAEGEAASAAAGKKPGIPLKIKDLSGPEKAIVCVIFAITGSSAAALVRPTLKYLAATQFVQTYTNINEESGFIKGPMAYRFMYFLVMWPMYSTLLLLIGTVFGRRVFFSHFVAKMWGRVLPKPAAAKLRQALAIE